MRQISTYIEYLLMTQHYAFLPGLGGFVLAEFDAKLKSGILLAPCRTVQFNRFMTHDDGLLANIIMEDTGCSYDEAQQRIRHEVALMLDRIQHEGRCQLGHMGQLFTDEECHVAFRPADTQFIDPLYYGRNHVVVRPWLEIERERQAALHPGTPVIGIQSRKHDDDLIMLPKYWLHRAAVVLLIICFFFSNFFLSSNRSDNQQQASMFNAEALITPFNNMESQSWDESWESESYAETAVAESESKSEAIPAAEPLAEAMPAAEPAPVQIASAEVAATPITSVAPQKRYYIIVASTTSPEEAQRVLKRFAKQGYDNLGMLERDGRLRIYIDIYDVKGDAETALKSLRTNSLFEKAWLLPVKCTSNSSSVLSLVDWTPLQLIIKEKDNDHFTMELSHLNQPAERDQG